MWNQNCHSALIVNSTHWTSWKKFSATSWGEHLPHRHINTIASWARRLPSTLAQAHVHSTWTRSWLWPWTGWRTQTSACSSSSVPCLWSYQESDSSFPVCQWLQIQTARTVTRAHWQLMSPSAEVLWERRELFINTVVLKLFHRFTASPSFSLLSYSFSKGTKINITILKWRKWHL